MRGRYCSVDGCSRPHYAKDLCQMHWTRQRNGGEVGTADSRHKHHARIQTWGSRCVLCRIIVSEGVSASSARDRLDLHLAIVHGIKVSA